MNTSTTLKKGAYSAKRIFARSLRSFSKRALIGGVLGAGAIIGLLLIPFREIHEYWGSLIASSISNEAVGITLTNPKMRPFGLFADGASIYLTEVPMVLDVTNLSCMVSPLGLIKLSLSLSCDATLFGGPLSLRSEQGFWTPQHVAIAGNRISISRYPILTALGFAKGDITFDGSGTLGDDGSLKAGKLSFTLNNIENTGKSLFLIGILQAVLKNSLPSPDLARTIKIPAFSQVSFEGLVEMPHPGAVKVTSIKTSLSLGTITSTGEITNLLSEKPSVLLKNAFTLSREGKASMAPFLPLISQGALTPLHESFLLSITGSFEQPVFTFSPPVPLPKSVKLPSKKE